MVPPSLQREVFPNMEGATLLSQLRDNGFARIKITDKQKLDVLHKQLIAVQQATTFRFPPEEGPVIYDSLKREVFQIMFDVARQCLLSVLNEVSTSDDNVRRLQRKLVLSNQQDLFQNPNAPFSEEQAFSGSFEH